MWSLHQLIQLTIRKEGYIMPSNDEEILRKKWRKCSNCARQHVRASKAMAPRREALRGRQRREDCVQSQCQKHKGSRGERTPQSSPWSSYTHCDAATPHTHHTHHEYAIIKRRKVRVKDKKHCTFADHVIIFVEKAAQSNKPLKMKKKTSQWSHREQFIKLI